MPFCGPPADAAALSRTNAPLLLPSDKPDTHINEGRPAQMSALKAKNRSAANIHQAPTMAFKTTERPATRRSSPLSAPLRPEGMPCRAADFRFPVP